MRLKNLDLITAILIVALNVGWMWVPDRPWFIGLILALPFILFLPGYALTQILFRKKPSGKAFEQTSSRSGSSEQATKSSHDFRLGHPIGGTDQIILSLGLSMAVDILVGFVLNILPIGLQTLSWTLSLGLLITLFALLALFVRRKYVATSAKAPRPRITLLDMLFLVLALFIIANAIWLSVIRPQTPQPSFTQLWMLPANSTSKDCAVSLGVQSFELTSAQYTITVTVNYQPVANKWSTIVLAPQQKWVQSMPVTPEGQNDLYIEAQLYKVDQPHTVYRNVHLTFHVATVLQNGQAQIQCSLGT